jgi:hypothetical protein
MSTKEKSNVVDFPGTFKGSNNFKSIKEIKEEYNNEALEFIFEQLLFSLDNFAYNTQSIKADERDLVMIYECLHSFMNRYHGLSHPMQEVVEQMFVDEIEEEYDDDQYEFDFDEE